MRAWWLVVLAGCWTTPRPAPLPESDPATSPETAGTNTAGWRSRPEPSHCARAIDHVVEVMQPEIDRVPMLRDRAQDLRDAAVESCSTTAWSEDVLTCYEQAADMTAMQPCNNLLGADQRADLDQRMNEVVKKPVP